ncbi:uncharacterized protein F5891DRAFT_1194345 [Suillus fuscotomentosus]|uniref:Uncharacterized protein n=1 Tax=Suillus fuscotomentosus TaxID=1912939 RepID=A0AAD4HF31_9AGAM|nr:uncharacterized protein F5891DRAFT_1194345 [Suillus fuscotomentosus]KAG1895290.1 hypothetical protein F5891DRAFT_1194345 [Suillus fuscotomentosus]
MFNKSTLLIIIGAAFAVAIPTGSIPKGPSTLDNVRVLDNSVSIPGVSDVKTPSTNYVGIADVDKEVSNLSLQLPQVEKEKAPTVPKDTSSAPVPLDESLTTDELPKVDASTIQSPSLPSQGNDKSEKTPDASTLTPPSGSASIAWYARTLPNNTTPQNPDASHMQSAVGEVSKVVMIKGNLPRERHIPGVHMLSLPSTPELTQSSPPKESSSPATDAAKAQKRASSPNVKPSSLARRAESCNSDYTLTYCKMVLQSDDSRTPKLLQYLSVDTSATGPVGLSCSDTQTTDYVYPLCTKMMTEVTDLGTVALDTVEAVYTAVSSVVTVA